MCYQHTDEFVPVLQVGEMIRQQVAALAGHHFAAFQRTGHDRFQSQMEELSSQRSNVEARFAAEPDLEIAAEFTVAGSVQIFVADLLEEIGRRAVKFPLRELSRVGTALLHLLDPAVYCSVVRPFCRYCVLRWRRRWQLLLFN